MNDRVPFKPDIEEAIISKKGHEGPWIEGLDFLSDTNYLRMAQFLGLSQREREDSRIAEKIAYLSDWAGEVGQTTDEITKKQIIKKLWNDLGVSYKGEELVIYLYRYARLDEEKRKAEGEMNLYKKEEPQEEKKNEVEEKVDKLQTTIDELSKKLEIKPKKEIVQFQESAQKNYGNTPLW